LGIRDLFNLGSKMEKFISGIQHLYAVLRIRIYRIHVFLGLPDPDPLVRGMDPDPAQEFLSLKNDVNVASKSDKQNKLF
jgi:hypothetical protein